MFFPFGCFFNSVILQQTIKFEARGLPYTMDVIEKSLKNTCRNVNKQVDVIIFFFCSNLQNTVVESFGFENDEACDFDFEFSDDLQFELVSLVSKS